IRPQSVHQATQALVNNPTQAEVDLFNWKTHAAPQPPQANTAIMISPAADLAASEPSEIVRIAIEGWYGDFLKTLHPNWTNRREDLESLIGFAERFEQMGELLTQLVLLNSETTDRSVEPVEHSVRLTTIHQAKGLEYPIVFVMGLAEGFFPLNRAIDEDNVEEERRLFYVAVTRAQSRLILTYPIISMQGNYPMRQEPSRFIREIPDELYKMVRIGGPKW
ncbi:MAG: hypothetical protein B7X06_02270, partial [Verrucomicrobia bacterium 21-51-4]